MYKVLVVDDEYPFVQSMIQYDWAAWNCILVGTALNGAEALRKCRHLQPQILITDINMPVMDGIELIDEVRKLIPDIQIILFTVYKEFEYAHRALHAGVIDYILKDINIREHIGEAIEKAKSAYTLNHRESNTAQIPDRIVYLQAAGDTGIDERTLKPYFSPPYEMLLSVRMAKADMESGISPDRINTLLSDGDLQIVLNEEETDFLFKDSSKSEADNFLSDLHKAIGDIRFIAAYSIEIDDIAECIKKHRANQSALDSAFYTGAPGLIQSNISSSAAPGLTPARMNEWIQRCTSCVTPDEILSEINGEILNEAMHLCYKPSALRRMFEKILYRMELKYDLTMEPSVRDKIEKAFSYSELCDTLTEGVRDILDRENRHGKIVQEAIDCLEKRLEDPSLQLSVVAGILGVSAGYLSKKLKDETGEGFQDLLIRLRMEKAVRLLRETNKKVYEIASECGYTNYRSFVNVFQNTYHVSPKQFK